MSGVEVFFDSNLFIYQSTSGDLTKQRIASELIEKAVLGSAGGISAQVMQECVNVLGGRYAVPAEVLDRYIANVLRPLLRVDTTAELIESALRVKRQWQYSFCDSLVIAGAIACGAKILYSEDLQHGQRLDGMVIINPFV
jgi:predicted nucleic acid-binding protein